MRRSTALDEAILVAISHTEVNDFRAAEQLQYYSTQNMVETAIWEGFERQLRELVTLPGVQEWWQLERLGSAIHSRNTSAA